MRQLSDIRGFTPALLSQLGKLSIHTPQALLLHLPLRYLDETRVTLIRDLRLGEQAQIEGVVVHNEVSYKPRKMLNVHVQDDSGILNLRFVHFYPSQIAAMQVGTRLRAFGEVRPGFFGVEMVHPQQRKVSEETPVSTALTPVYPTAAGVSQNTLRKAVQRVLTQDYLQETLPAWVYQDIHLPDFASSVQLLHQPTPETALNTLEDRSHPAWQRLAFDELLAQQLSMRLHYARRKQARAPAIAPSRTLVPALCAQLPFALTPAQQKVGAEITHDLTQPHPMQRLLQGDVGSGKTIVACLAALQLIEQGWQVAIMAPTEILAEQHYKKMHGWLTPLGIDVAWLTGSQPKRERAQSLARIASGEAMLAVGTHALFQDEVQFKQLGLAIVDEQHRFGVEQRLALRRKGQQHAIEPHQLMMSATPIPRTLSMSYYADLDVSVIDELPPGRTPVVTKLVADDRREEILQRVREACALGHQAYWVCPLIEESEALQLQTANDTYAYMQGAFPELQVGLVHGRMKPAEKQAVMQAFAANHLHLLVATTVIEVGVDVPNASLMVIDHAERMGLSQLHQLRGRVGRGAAKSTCILLYSKQQCSKIGRARLKVIYENTDGFVIAQADLQIRGPGELLGTRQSGVPMLKIADLERDAELLVHAKQKADALLARAPQSVEVHLQRWLSQGAEWVKV
ncbi:ATP-dependent DNA helicase RecG [Methylophilus aquaticus]|uniref:ATP-dependent DNA helicase RecG n=1 Tax=Methylophilus aquaticus TaxID=1971610 RepID=A0ABT9JQ37_9PROT|nr:ATP-dependent DNA helicase RecG [Methylophilus aquaticus]MDP8566260.1 ATP-dependent DNA helicase RecG [Methylophilus aquaticus]